MSSGRVVASGWRRGLFVVRGANAERGRLPGHGLHVPSSRGKMSDRTDTTSFMDE
jgi:hypothetical protein